MIFFDGRREAPPNAFAAMFLQIAALTRRFLISRPPTAARLPAIVFGTERGSPPAHDTDADCRRLRRRIFGCILLLLGFAQKSKVKKEWGKKNFCLLFFLSVFDLLKIVI
ncbi:MAG: hypothetical protein M1383_00580 [Patescibacteria group bacterium]|nr:hypothetical protein [Patescibacteria group bacterium]